jgi:hypothetical protein
MYDNIHKIFWVHITGNIQTWRDYARYTWRQGISTEVDSFSTAIEHSIFIYDKNKHKCTNPTSEETYKHLYKIVQKKNKAG